MGPAPPRYRERGLDAAAKTERLVTVYPGKGRGPLRVRAPSSGASGPRFPYLTPMKLAFFVIVISMVIIRANCDEKAGSETGALDAGDPSSDREDTAAEDELLKKEVSEDERDAARLSGPEFAAIGIGCLIFLGALVVIAHKTGNPQKVHEKHFHLPRSPSPVQPLTTAQCK